MLWARGPILALHAVAALCLPPTAPAQASEIAEQRFRSTVLGREYAYTVYTPTGYGTSGLRYPVLYLLHGANGNQTSWSRDGRLKLIADSLIAGGLIPPVLIVMPGDSVGWWVDAPGGASETALLTELIPDAERRYRILRERSGRMVAGQSMGGYGALRFALKYPDRFAAAALHGPAVYFDAPPATSAARQHPPFRSTDGSFSLAEWRSRNYPTLLDAYFAQPARVPIYIVSGDHDPLGIAAESVRLFDTLRARQPGQVELRIVDGGHEWAVWISTFADALRYMTRYVAQPRPN
ncbi:MAG: esterase family protein [Gemmatimonadetes bacterium]|nr:esterase family protein [Gemmatimonadota bacterium]